MADTEEKPPQNEEKLSKNEQKRRQKALEKAEKERKKQERAAKEGKPLKNGTDGKKSEQDQEITDPDEYFSSRKAFVNQQKELGLNPYPHKFAVSISLTDYIEKYGDCEIGHIEQSIVESVAGRVHAKREQGAKLVFLDLRAEGKKIQVMANLSFYKDELAFGQDISKIKRGDIVGCRGYPGKTKKGELSIVPIEITLLTPCLRMLPHLHYGLRDRETRYRMRFLDLLLNEHVRDKFVIRAKISHAPLDILRILRDRLLLAIFMLRKIGVLPIACSQPAAHQHICKPDDRLLGHSRVGQAIIFIDFKVK